MRATMVRAAATALLALGAAGCVNGPPGGPTSPNLPFDGVWRGPVTPLVGGPPACAGDRFGVIVVGDGAITFPYRPAIIFVAMLPKDGTIKATSNGSTMQGKLAGDQLDVTVTNAACKTHYQLDRMIGM